MSSKKGQRGWHKKPRRTKQTKEITIAERLIRNDEIGEKTRAQVFHGIDPEQEYDLIQKKQSQLSARKRAQVVFYMENKNAK